MAAANSFFRTMVEEKEMLHTSIEIEDKSGTMHFMTVENVIEAIEQTSESEQYAIEQKFRHIDFHNGDLLHFIKHLGLALAEAHRNAKI